MPRLKAAWESLSLVAALAAAVSCVSSYLPVKVSEMLVDVDCELESQLIEIVA